MNKFLHDELDQSYYDSFNQFIFSPDTKLFGKLASKLFYTELTKDVPGNIVELGVFKGSGVMAWLKCLKLISINHKECYGFDIFDQDALVKNIGTKDAELMGTLFTGRNHNSVGYETILSEMAIKSGFNNLRLIVGNVFDTMPMFLDKNPGFRASIINFDLDTSEPTTFCLNLLWDRLVVGGIMIFDEYAINEWTESDAVDKFINEKKLRLIATPYLAPSAYLIKEH
jgi:hypothetical protein